MEKQITGREDGNLGQGVTPSKWNRTQDLGWLLIPLHNALTYPIHPSLYLSLSLSIYLPTYLVIYFFRIHTYFLSPFFFVL